MLGILCTRSDLLYLCPLPNADFPSHDNQLRVSSVAKFLFLLQHGYSNVAMHKRDKLLVVQLVCECLLKLHQYGQYCTTGNKFTYHLTKTIPINSIACANNYPWDTHRTMTICDMVAAHPCQRMSFPSNLFEQWDIEILVMFTELIAC